MIIYIESTYHLKYTVLKAHFIHCRMLYLQAKSLSGNTTAGIRKKM